MNDCEQPQSAGETTGQVLGDWTLVLNKSWVPVDVTTVLRALCKVYQGVAQVVHPHDYSMHDFGSWVESGPLHGGPALRSTAMAIPVPEVIVLSRYNKVPHRCVSFTRWNLFKRDAYTCQYCGRKPKREHLTIDHVVPRSRGGRSGWTNCVVACQSCNSRKGSHTLKEVGLTLERPPVKPNWSPRLIVGEQACRDSWSRFMSAG
ncbi:MAG: HNH endonuclease [Planctomycetes bacterium]|nr:HNH endonuclease [Planctomycetota bacterium]